MCKCTTGGERIIRLTYGNTAGGGSVVFDFQLGRARAGPKQFPRGFNGILQTDGYAAYDKVGGPQLVHAACWSHSRRRFYEAHQVCAGESVAKGVVMLIDDVFGIDAQARAHNLAWAARDRLRQQHARPLLETMRQQIEAARDRLCRPASWVARSPARWGCGSG